jgi:hypothetical protein
VRQAAAALAGILVSTLTACGGGSSTPTSPGGGVTAVPVGVSGNGSGTLAPGETRQLSEAHTRSVDADGFIEIAGLSGQNPNGRHHVVLLKR